MTSSMKLFRLSWTVIILAFSFIYAQQDDYKDTIWVKVTFYDFHSDGSNPEFECPMMAACKEVWWIRISMPI